MRRSESQKVELVREVVEIYCIFCMACCFKLVLLKSRTTPITEIIATLSLYVVFIYIYIYILYFQSVCICYIVIYIYIYFVWITYTGNYTHICSMYGIFTYMHQKLKPNVGRYSIHGAYGV